MTWGCASDAAEPPASAAQPERLVTTKGTFSQRILLSGELDAAEGAVISVPRLPEWQTSIQWLALEGTEVREGDVVVELDTSSFTKDLEENRRREDEARQRLEQAEADAAAERSSRTLEAEAKQVELEQAELEFRIPAELISRNDYQDPRACGGPRPERARQGGRNASRTRSLDECDTQQSADRDRDGQACARNRGACTGRNETPDTEERDLRGCRHPVGIQKNPGR